MKESQSGETNASNRTVNQQREKQSQNDADWRGDQHVNRGVSHHLPEVGIGKQVCVIIQADKGRFPKLGEIQALTKQALVKGEQGRLGRKQGNKNACRQYKQIGKQLWAFFSFLHARLR